jgi:hypothetical protein
LNIGHDWKFTEQNNQVLRKYYETNKLLAKCLQNEILSDSICREIEETMLLPIAEIEKRKRENIE